MFSARQAILDELEMWHPFLLQGKPMAAALSPSLVGYRYRLYTNTYKGNDVLVAYIVDKRRSTGRSYYSKTLLDLVVVKMDFATLC